MNHSKRGTRSAIAILALAALVTACHHHDDDNNSMAPPAGSSPPPVATDAFVSYVSQTVATQSDTAEPASIDGVAVTSPEDAEPIPLTGP